MPSAHNFGEILEVKFRQVEEKFPKLNEGDSIVYPNGQGQLKLVNEAYCFYGASGKNRKITICDDKNHRRVMFDVGNSLIVNNYYRIAANGMVEFDPLTEQNVAGQSVCGLKVHPSSDEFEMRIKWSGRLYYFDVYKNGVLYIDPATKTMQTVVGSDANANGPPPTSSHDHNSPRMSFEIYSNSLNYNSIYIQIHNLPITDSEPEPVLKDLLDGGTPEPVLNDSLDDGTPKTSDVEYDGKYKMNHTYKIRTHVDF